MRIITSARLKEFYEKHPDSKSSLEGWNKFTTKASWQNFVEVRETFAAASSVENFTVFNISGNKYRLISYIDYEYKTVFIRGIMTHAEYDKEKWKDDPWYRKT